jgi:bifunctional UDP-N-acetylglucosamine pyrophosphorylase/glucosamine-1-phosphate N-acetyltransferase
MSRPVVIVLAGGVSSRLWPLRDKLFFEFGSQSLLERHLRGLRAAGCERFIIVSRPDTRDAIASSIAAAGMDQAEVVVQPEARGMADAVLCAAPALTALGETPVFITQAHDVADLQLHADLIEGWSQNEGLAGLIAAARVQSYFPGGYLRLEGDRVVEVIEKPGAGNEPSDLVNLVAHIHGSWRPLVEALQVEEAVGGADDAYERGLSRLMQTGRYRVAPYEGRWQALKYPWHLLDVMALLLERWTAGLESPGPDYEQREDGVFIGRDVRIFPGAYVVAPALIGHGSVIGHNALVRESLIGPRCVVGFGSEVARSYLAEGVELHHNYVGDSVLDRETAMGYGAVTANYRIDGRTVPMFAGTERIDTGRMKLGLILGARSRLGVNTSTMPGVKIGAGAVIGPNLKVTRDVPDGATVLDEETYGRF